MTISRYPAHFAISRGFCVLLVTALIACEFELDPNANIRNTPPIAKPVSVPTTTFDLSSWQRAHIDWRQQVAPIMAKH